MEEDLQRRRDAEKSSCTIRPENNICRFFLILLLFLLLFWLFSPPSVCNEPLTPAALCQKLCDRKPSPAAAGKSNYSRRVFVSGVLFFVFINQPFFFLVAHCDDEDVMRYWMFRCSESFRRQEITAWVVCSMGLMVAGGVPGSNDTHFGVKLTCRGAPAAGVILSSSTRSGLFERTKLRSQKQRFYLSEQEEELAVHQEKSHHLAVGENIDH